MTNLAWHKAIATYTLALRAAGQSEETVRLRRYHLHRISAKMAPKGPWAITGEDLTAWTGAQTWAAETRRSYRSTLRGFYDHAHRHGHITTNPALALERVKPAQPRPRPTPETAYRHALALADARERLALRLGAEAGLRRGEIVLVHARDLFEDLDGWSLIVHGKGNRQRIVPLLDDLATTVRLACANGGGYAFPGRINGHLSPHRLGRLVSALLPEGINTHSLRHRFATRTYAVDTDLLTVQELLGHASPETTRRYVQLPNAALRRTVNAAAGRRPPTRPEEPETAAA